MFPAPLACILGAAAIVSLSYLWLCGRCGDMGAHIKALEDRKAELRKRVINEEYKWANMKSPHNIEQLLQKFNLAMTWPDESRTVRLRLHAANPPASAPQAVSHEAKHQFVQDTGAAMND